MNRNVSWMLQLQVGKGRQDDLRELMTEMVEATEAGEPGTLIYDWCLSDDGNACHIYERYTDSAAAMIHIGNFGSKFAERFFALLTPTGFFLYGSPDASVREALAGFSPTIMPSVAGFGR